jgi:hypothetical protein
LTTEDRIGGSLCYLKYLKALDHRHSSGVFTNPAKTGFCSIYLLIFSNEAELRTQWSYANESKSLSVLQVLGFAPRLHDRGR